MKKNIYLLIVSLLLLQSCSSDSSNDSTTSSVLCKTIKSTNASGDIYREEFTYDGNKISQVNYYSNDILEEKTFVYYKGNLISEVKSYNKDNNLSSTGTFTYNNSGQLISKLSIAYESNTNYVYKENFSYNQNGTISALEYSGNETIQNTLEGNRIYTILDNEIVEEEVNGNYSYKHTYTYDTKNGPFKNAAGFDWYSTGDNFNAGIRHNVTKNIYSSQQSNTISNYNYTYNSDNYPILQTSSQNEDTVEYIYIINNKTIISAY